MELIYMTQRYICDEFWERKKGRTRLLECVVAWIVISLEVTDKGWDGWPAADSHSFYK